MENSDGKIIIETVVETKDVDKKIAYMEKRLKEFDEKAKRPIEIDGAKVTGLQNLTDEEIQEYNKIQDELREIYKERLDFNNVEKMVTNEIQAQNAVIENQKEKNLSNNQTVYKLSKELEKMIDDYNRIKKADIITEENISYANELKKEIFEITKQIEKIGGGKVIVRGITDANEESKKLKDNLKNIASGAIKWAGAMFGIRTIYNGIRSATNNIMQYDDQLKANSEYIGYALSNTIKPVIESIFNLIVKTLQYVNYIAKAWTGRELFASSKEFNKMKKNAEGTSKAVEKTRKSLAGFDVANVLSDNVSAAKSSGSTTPNIDLSSIQGDVPDIIKGIADNGEIVVGVIAAIGTAIAGTKIVKFISDIGKLNTNLSEYSKKGAGIALFATGIVFLVTNIYDLITSWDKLTTKEKILKVSLAALGAAFIAFGYAIATGISVATLGIGALIAAIISIITLIGSFIIKLVSEEKAIKDVTTAQEDLTKAQEDYASSQEEYINAIDNAEEAFKRLKQAQDDTGISGEELYKSVENGIIDYKDMTEQQKEVYKAYLDNIKAQDNATKASENLKNAKEKEKMASWDLQLATAKESDTFDDFKKSVVDAFDKGELSADEAKDLIGKSMSEMSRKSQETFMQDIPNSIKEGLDPKKYETLGQKLSKFFGGIWDGIKSGASSAWKKVTSIFSGNTNSNTNTGGYGNSVGFAKGGIIYRNPIKLAKGGIINNPSKGVPLEKPIGGESGKEGVLPLTDNQQMEYLGQSIGRYVRINNFIENNMDSKRINRITSTSYSNRNFALNRG